MLIKIAPESRKRLRVPRACEKSHLWLETWL